MISDGKNAVIARSAVIPESVRINPFCVIGENVVMGEGVVLGIGCVLADGVRIEAGCELGNYVTLGKDVILGKNVRVGDHTTIYPGAELGEDCFAGSNASIGRMPRPAATSTVKVPSGLEPLKMGKSCTVGCAAVLYAGSVYGDQVLIGDCATVRERCQLANNVIVGSGAAVENDTRIGAFTKIQTGSYITAYMDIADHVFIAPMVTTTNDNFMGRTEKRFKYIKGATIGRGARIGGGSILLPGIHVAPETFVAAGALVTKDTEERRVIKGFPARDVREVPSEELL